MFNAFKDCIDFLGGGNKFLIAVFSHRQRYKKDLFIALKGQIFWGEIAIKILTRSVDIWTFINIVAD